MFADSVEYVDLEITNESMISRIGILRLLTQQSLFATAAKRMSCFLTVSETSAAGSGQRGEGGPEEYLAPLRIDADGERIRSTTAGQA